MKLGRFALVMGGSAVMVFAIACSSSSSDDSSATGNDSGSGTDTSTGGGDSGGGPKDSGGGSCKNLEDGNYTLHYSGPDGGPGCPPADSTITIGSPDGGDAGGGLPGCTTTTNSSTCVVTLHCDLNNAGYDTVIDVVETPNAAGNGGSGTYSTTTTQPDGGPFSSCTGVTFTITKS